MLDYKELILHSIMFIFFPHGGLANRMRATLSALQLSYDKKINIKIFWVKDSSLNCEWRKLFLKHPNIFDCPFVSFRLFNYLVRILRFLHLESLCRIFHSNDDSEFQEYVKTEISNHKLTIASSYSEFYQGSVPDFRDVFVLVPELKTRIDAIVSQWPSNTIGIHIRRGDNQWAIEHSPIQLFEEYVNKEIEKDNHVKFYVASDDLSCIEYFKEKFGNCIITACGEKTRNTVSGIQQAIVELFALSSCKYIIGSYYSSFSEMAAKLGGISLFTVKKN